MHHEVDPREAEVVEKLFYQVADGVSLTRAVRNIAEQGGRTRRGQPLTRASAAHILRNKRYMGRGAYPPIVDVDTYWRVQSVLNEPSRHNNLVHNNRPRYLLTGIVMCGVCGRGMNVFRNGSYRAYRCYQPGDHTVTRSMSFTDSVVRDTLIDLADHPRDSSDPIFWFSYTVKAKRRDAWDRMPLSRRRALVKSALEVRIDPATAHQQRSGACVRISRREIFL